jgi:hypothetical protein
MTNEEDLDIESPYCGDCGACGETECCSPFICLRKSVSKNKDCMYGETHLKEIELYYKLGLRLYDLILEKGNENNVKIVNEIYNELHKKIYGDKNDRSN